MQCCSPGHCFQGSAQFFHTSMLHITKVVIKSESTSQRPCTGYRGCACVVAFLYPAFKTELIHQASEAPCPTPHLPAVTGAILLVALQIRISHYKWWLNNHPSKQINLHFSPRHTTTHLPRCIFKYQSGLPFMTPPTACHSHILSSAKLERASDHGTFMTFESSAVHFYLCAKFESGSVTPTDLCPSKNPCTAAHSTYITPSTIFGRRQQLGINTSGST